MTGAQCRATRRKVSGKTRTCTFPAGHPGDCLPVLLLKDEAKFAELSRLIFEHMDEDVRCGECGHSQSNNNQPDTRCEWMQTVNLTVAALHARLSAHGVEMPDVRDEDELRKAAER